MNRRTVLYVTARFLNTHSFARVYVRARSVTHSGLTLCDPMDCSPRGSSVRGLFQARTLEWLPFPPPGDLPDPGIEPGSPALQADSLPLSHREAPSLTHVC